MNGETVEKNIFLCRHGESEYNAKRIIQGHIDTDLTPKGVVQARLAAEELKSFPIERIFTSDLRRAYRTAQIIADVLGLEVEVDKRLREMHFGEWEGLTYDHIYKNHIEDFHNWLKNPVACPLPSQEDIEEFKERISSFIEFLKNIKEKNILIVGHGGSIQGIICLATGLGLEHLWGLRHANTGISCLRLYESIPSDIKFLNYSNHLEKYVREEPIL